MVRPQNQQDLETEATELAPDEATGSEGTGIGNIDPGMFPPSSTIRTGASGTNVYPYPNRYINNNSENLRWAENDKLTSFTGVSIKKISGIPALQNQLVYVGPSLVDENNNIVRVSYSDDGSDIGPEYWNLQTDADRSLLLKTAQRLGYYGDGKPSDVAVKGFGLQNEDKRAIQDLLDFSVGLGRTWKAVAGMVAGGVIAVGNVSSGGGRAYSTVSKKDAEQALTEASFRYLGRALTKNEINAAVQRIQAEERAAAMGRTEDPASLSVAAKGQVEAISPAEATAYKVGGAINRIFALLGGS
jgi:hypothetical protein